ncbi:hypothetical protein CEXT_279101 [Caerostris extrusa]|uniref:Uncharacterized protein n=1 Tax=Caerostris extrusa TaxID=172846 RepID=A0AAV4Y8E8_CAEEX|nr:hypothetical protein CEXT_279101 [Caerostris extrusa]
MLGLRRPSVPIACSLFRNGTISTRLPYVCRREDSDSASVSNGSSSIQKPNICSTIVTLFLKAECYVVTYEKLLWLICWYSEDTGMNTIFQLVV